MTEEITLITTVEGVTYYTFTKKHSQEKEEKDGDDNTLVTDDHSSTV